MKTSLLFLLGRIRNSHSLLSIGLRNIFGCILLSFVPAVQASTIHYIPNPAFDQKVYTLWYNSNYHLESQRWRIGDDGFLKATLDTVTGEFIVIGRLAEPERDVDLTFDPEWYGHPLDVYYRLVFDQSQLESGADFETSLPMESWYHQNYLGEIVMSGTGTVGQIETMSGFFSNHSSAYLFAHVYDMYQGFSMEGGGTPLTFIATPEPLSLGLLLVGLGAPFKRKGYST